MFSAKKKVGTAIGGVVVVGAAIAMTAGTFSYFSDSATVRGGNVTSGTIELGEHFNGGTITGDAIAPGWSQSRTVTLTNNGSLPGELRIGLVEAGGTTNDAALENALRVCIDKDADGTNDQCGTLAQALAYTGGGMDLGKLDPEASHKFTVTVSLPESTGNVAQGKQVHINAVADLLQIDNNAPTDSQAFPAPAAS